MRIEKQKGDGNPAEQLVHTELAGGRFGALYRTSMPFIKIRITKQNLILSLGLIALGMYRKTGKGGSGGFLRGFRIPLDKIAYVQTQKTLLVSEVRIVHSAQDVPAAISVLSLDPARLLRLFSWMGIRVDDRAGVLARARRHRVGAYLQVVGEVFLFVIGLLVIVAMTIWALREITTSFT